MLVSYAQSFATGLSFDQTKISEEVSKRLHTFLPESLLKPRPEIRKTPRFKSLLRGIFLKNPPLETSRCLILTRLLASTFSSILTCCDELALFTKRSSNFERTLKMILFPDSFLQKLLFPKQPF